METAASTSAPPASAVGSGAASRGRRSLVTNKVRAAAALAAASKPLDDENDGIYVVPVFTTRDNGAGHTEDKDDAEGDVSSDEETNAECQWCVECVSGSEFKAFFSPLGRFFRTSFVLARSSGITLASFIQPLRRPLAGPASVKFESKASVTLSSKASRKSQEDRQVEGKKKPTGGKKKTFCAAPVTVMAQKAWLCPPTHPPTGYVSA